MATDLTKMVEDAVSKHLYNEKPPVSGLTLLRILKVVAIDIELVLNTIEHLRKKIKANEAEIEKLKSDLEHQTDRYDDNIGV